MTQASHFQLKKGVDNYAVFGNPIAHSKSPVIHHLFASQCNQNIHYQSVLVAKDAFDSTLREFREAGGKGLNVTLPFKAEAYASSDTVSVRARQAAAVNTITFQADGQVFGDNTDGVGLVRDLQANNVELAGARVILLGAGGAARGVLGVLLEQMVRDITIANRTLTRAEELVNLFAGHGTVRACGYDDLQETSADIVINATSSGLDGERPPVASSIVSGAFCYDMIYGAGARPFLDWAIAQGARGTADGLGMLVYQAAEAFHLWRGEQPDAAAVISSLRAG